MKNLLTACLLTTALCGASHAATLFDFNNNSDLNSALDDQAGPVSFTNSGLIATFTASDGTMNRTSNNGLGINSTISGDDTAAFDVGEWIDITFESA
ncbi:MAG TPA: hypothetical protein VJ904_03125, partial [Tichowtungia sp.]|nr:hypothetical protein [Tichowtungia sp.]